MKQDTHSSRHNPLTVPGLTPLQSASISTLLNRVSEAGSNTDSVTEQMLRALAIDQNDPELKALLELHLARGLNERFTNGNPWVPSAPRSFPGTPGLVIGTVPETGAPYHLSYDMGFLPHIYGAGASGFGKTNVLLLNLAQILGNSRPPSSQALTCSLPVPQPPAEETPTFLSLEKKPAARYLLPYTAPGKLVIFDSQTLLYSFLQPIEGVRDYRGLLERRLDIFCVETEIRSPSRFLLMEVCLRECEKRGVLSGNSDDYPAPAEICEALKRLRFSGLDRRSRYRESLLNRLSGLLISCPEILNCRQGIPIHELDRINSAIELPNVASDVRRLLFSWLLNDLYVYRETAQLQGTIS